TKTISAPRTPTKSAPTMTEKRGDATTSSSPSPQPARLPAPSIRDPTERPKLPPDAGRLPRLDRRRHKPMRHFARIQVVPHDLADDLVEIVDAKRSGAEVGRAARQVDVAVMTEAQHEGVTVAVSVSIDADYRAEVVDPESLSFHGVGEFDVRDGVIGVPDVAMMQARGIGIRARDILPVVDREGPIFHAQRAGGIEQPQMGAVIEDRVVRAVGILFRSHKLAAIVDRIDGRVGGA